MKYSKYFIGIIIIGIISGIKFPIYNLLTQKLGIENCIIVILCCLSWYILITKK